MDTKEIRLLYNSFGALYQEAPKIETGTFSDKEIWEHYHNLIDKLNQRTNEDYNDCKIAFSLTTLDGYLYWQANPREYRSKLNDLISRLHTLYFNDEPLPNTPQSAPFLQQNISNKAEVEANVCVTLVLQLNNQLHSAKDKAKTDEEKSFVDMIIQKVDKVKSYIEFAILVMKTAKQYGIGIDRLISLFS